MRKAEDESYGYESKQSYAYGKSPEEPYYPAQQPGYSQPTGYGFGGQPPANNPYHKPAWAADVEAGYGHDDAPQPYVVPGAFSAQAEKQARLSFIRKVYSILAVQLLVTFGFSAITMYNQPTNTYILSHPGLALFGIIASFAVLIALMCYQRSYPTNMALLGVFTMLEAYTISTVTAAYARAGEGDLVIKALFITFALFAGLTLFTMQSKMDFGFLRMGLMAGLLVMIVWGLVGAIFGFHGGFIYSLLGSVLFSGYIIFDTWLLTKKLSYDDWVLAAISLYLDIINLFLFILQLLASQRDRN